MLMISAGIMRQIWESATCSALTAPPARADAFPTNRAASGRAWGGWPAFPWARYFSPGISTPQTGFPVRDPDRRAGQPPEAEGRSWRERSTRLTVAGETAYLLAIPAERFPAERTDKRRCGSAGILSIR